MYITITLTEHDVQDKTKEISLNNFRHLTHDLIASASSINYNDAKQNIMLKSRYGKIGVFPVKNQVKNKEIKRKNLPFNLRNI